MVDNFWYLPDEGKKATPLVVEFAFDYTAIKETSRFLCPKGRTEQEQYFILE